MARKKGVKLEKSEAEHEKLNNEILKLRDSVLEEFDMIELIEDSIKDVFDCDLNCATCSREEQGKCMQGFKKANLYWLRKIAQDEEMLKEVVDKIDGMREGLVKMMTKLREYYKEKATPKEVFEEHKQQVKNKLKNSHGYDMYS